MSWLVRFSIDLPEIGPVHARIALTGERATVTLNAERAESAELLTAGLPLLDAGLRGAQLEPGELRCRAGGTDQIAAARRVRSGQRPACSWIRHHERRPNGARRRTRI